MEYNWGLIRSGETFQALVNALLRAENPTLIGFSRLGKDGAQDARSADGTKVWQAKYHSEITGSHLISDATKELKNIEKYRDPKHVRFGQWKDVKEWNLVTTDSFNPTDQAAWNNTIATRAEKLDLKATFTDRARLEELLNKHRDIAEAFFGNANRCLLSLGEAHDFVSADTIGAEGLKVELVGRAAQIDLAKDFLDSDKKLISVIGPGGIGKTRFLLEVGKIAENVGFRVLWGLEAAMTASSAWLIGEIAEQKTLLLIDEPKDPRLIDQLV